MKWDKVKLTDVCDFQGGTQPPKASWSADFKPGYIRMLQIRDFTQGKDSYIEYVKDSKTLKKCQEKDILIGRYGASIGKILTGLSGAYNVALVKTVPSNKINRQYLYYYLLAKPFQNFIQNAGSRAAQAGFNKEELGTLFLPLPPLHIQEQIANTLDKADALRRKDQELLTKYDKLAQAIFYDMFGDPVKNEKGINKISLGNLTEINSGSTPSREKSEYYNGSIPWVKTTEVKGSVITEVEEHISELGLQNSSCNIYEKGSVVIAMYGQGKTRGNVGLLNVNAATNQACAVIRPSKNLISEFLFYQLKYSYEDLRSLGRGGNQPNLNVGIVKNYSVMVPSINAQSEFCYQIEKLNSVSEISKKNQLNSIRLFKTLIHQYFN